MSAGSNASYQTAGHLNLQHCQHPAKADVLAGHHRQFKKLGVGEMPAHIGHVGVTDIVMIHRHFLGEMDGCALTGGEFGIVGVVDASGGFAFADNARCNTHVFAQHTAVEGGDPQADQFLKTWRKAAGCAAVPGIVKRLIVLHQFRVRPKHPGKVAPQPIVLLRRIVDGFQIRSRRVVLDQRHT